MEYAQRAVESDSYYVQFWCGCLCRPPFNRQHVEMGKAHLGRVKVLGLVEAMDEFVELLNGKVWWSHVSQGEGGMRLGGRGLGWGVYGDWVVVRWDCM